MGNLRLAGKFKTEEKMKLENYVPSVETCRKLRDAGLVQESIYMGNGAAHGRSPVGTVK